jgi:CheY-like chemotaxis protein/anti-sigma regulatory factor (Ser/Thr protein kinase)
VSIRVLLVDDVVDARRLVRTALRFRGDFAIAGEASNGHEAVALASELQPDIVVLDLGLPDLAGQDVLRGIRHAAPAAKVVVFSGMDPETSGLTERVEGYVLKDADIDYLTELLETVARESDVQASMTLPPDLASAGGARDFVRSVLERWGTVGIVDDAALVVTELVANAIVHARTECEIRLSMGPNSLRIEVVDFGAGTPDPMLPSVTRNHGRGLHLIDALTAAWGVEPLEAGNGKRVWAELLYDGDTSESDALTS